MGRALITTEKRLREIVESPSSIWNLLVNKQDNIIISTNSTDNSFDNNIILQRLHNKQIKIIPQSKIVNELPDNPLFLEALSDCIFLLDIPEKKARELSRDYGVCCLSTESDNPPYITEEGWFLETGDPEKEKSWDSFYMGINRNCSSTVLIDRFLFSIEWNKRNGCPDDKIEDCCYNLKSIIDNIIPFEVNDNKYVLTIIFKSDGLIKKEKRDANGQVINGQDGHILYEYYSFKEIVAMIEEIREEIYRPFDYDLEVISVSKSCPYYNETHDRYVITNFHITTASQKLVAFTPDEKVLHNQTIHFYYIYSTGLRNERSSIPIATKERVLSAMSRLISESNPYSINYALNGRISRFNKNIIKNKLLK